jgi:hypothetical protein
LGLSGGVLAAEAPAWVTESGPYMTTEARPKQVVILHDGGGRRATLVRMHVQSAEEGLPDRDEPGWRPTTLAGMDWARIEAANWGACIDAAGEGWRYQLQIQGQGVTGDVIASAWAAGRAAYVEIQHAGQVAHVHSKSPAELSAELWCGELEDVTEAPEPTWWVRSNGLVKSAVLARTVEQGTASGVAKRFPSPVPRVFYLLQLAQFRGSPVIQIRWFEGDKEVAAREMTVYGSGAIWGSLQASGDGLAAGRYAVEITSGDGKEVRLEFLVEPAGRQERRETPPGE